MESFGAGVLRGQMVRLRNRVKILKYEVLELCCSEWFQNFVKSLCVMGKVLELCCSEWFQNMFQERSHKVLVLELCCSEWFQNCRRLSRMASRSFRAVLF